MEEKGDTLEIHTFSQCTISQALFLNTGEWYKRAKKEVNEKKQQNSFLNPIWNLYH